MHALKNRISHLIENGRLNEALQQIHHCVESIITQPLCTAQIFGSKALDNLCQDIGKINFDKLRSKGFIGSFAVKDNQEEIFVYIVTKLQKSGGHTRIIQDFIKARPTGKHIILSTELDGRSDSSYLLNELTKRHLVLEWAPKGNYHERLIWLQKRLLEIRPLKVYLFNHHQDSVAVAAIQPDMNFTGAFYHHGDHHLCLGVYLSHLEHIDPHPMGYHFCKNTLKINNLYIPFVVEDRGIKLKEQDDYEQVPLTTCTVARANKIEIPYIENYIDVLSKLLKTTGGKHIHIGKLSHWSLFKIRRKLRIAGITVERFIYIPWVPSVWQALQDFQVDLYIASFPYGAGLTLIEAMGAGIPVILHRHIFSRVLSGFDLAYPNVLTWRYSEELLAICKRVTPDMLRKHGKLARKQYENFHRPEILVQTFQNKDTILSIPMLSDAFKVETDEYAFWIDKQLKFSNLMRNEIYKLLKRLRAKVSCLI